MPMGPAPVTSTLLFAAVMGYQAHFLADAA
jgi:hypothetical protein